MPVTKGNKTITLSLASGPTAEIYYYGATVTSWKVGGKERLFVSSKAALDGSKAIRGGIPICWPTFGPPPKKEAETDASLAAHAQLAQHGFARNSTWTLGETVMDREEGVSVRMYLDPSAETAKIFPHPFHLTYVITLTPHQLSTDLHVVNPLPSSVASITDRLVGAAQSVASALPASIAPSSATLDSVRAEGEQAKEGAQLKFQALLHTYLRVEDAGSVRIKGIPQGTQYVDKVKGGSVRSWEGGDLKIEQETDRVYRDVGNGDIIVSDKTGDVVKVHKVEFKDVVTWNPREATGSAIADMEAGGWDHYVCVEPGFANGFKTLQPGEEWIGQQVLTAL